MFSRKRLKTDSPVEESVFIGVIRGKIVRVASPLFVPVGLDEGKFFEAGENLGFKFSVFGELLGEFGFEGGDARVEFLGGDVFVFDFDVEILSGGKAVVFFFDFVVRDDDGKIVDSFFVAKRFYDLLNFVGTKAFLFVGAFLVFFSELGGVDKDDGICAAGFIEEEHGDIRSRGCENVGGHGNATVNDFFIDEFLQNFLFDSGFGGDEAGGDDDGGFSCGSEGIDDVLKEAGVNRHFGFGWIELCRSVGNSRPEAFRLRSEVGARVVEIKFERRIGDDEIELFERRIIGFFVRGIGERVALADIVDRTGEIVQNQVEAKELGGF